MGKKKTRYTKEFKLEAVKLVTEQGYTQAEAAKNLGIEAKNLNRWVHEPRISAVRNGLKVQLTEEQKELQQLRKEVKRLKMEREILKKAAAFFANESY
jgi:transposase